MTTIRGSNPVATSCFPTPSATPLPQMQPVNTDRAQFRDAVATLKANFGDLRGGFLGMSDTIDMNELYQATQSRNPQVAQAARFLLAHPEMLNQLDTARHGGSTDGKISLSDIDSQLGSLDREQQVRHLMTDPRMGQFAQSLQTIAAHGDRVDTAGFFNIFRDGKISMEDLNRTAGDASAPMELRQAALFMAANPDLWSIVDTAAEGGRRDGIVSAKDINAFWGQLSNVIAERQPSFTTPHRTY